MPFFRSLTTQRNGDPESAAILFVNSQTAMPIFCQSAGKRFLAKTIKLLSADYLKTPSSFSLYIQNRVKKSTIIDILYKRS